MYQPSGVEFGDSSTSFRQLSNGSGVNGSVDGTSRAQSQSSSYTAWMASGSRASSCASVVIVMSSAATRLGASAKADASNEVTSRRDSQSRLDSLKPRGSANSTPSAIDSFTPVASGPGFG